MSLADEILRDELLDMESRMKEFVANEQWYAAWAVSITETKTGIFFLPNLRPTNCVTGMEQ